MVESVESVETMKSVASEEIVEKSINMRLINTFRSSEMNICRKLELLLQRGLRKSK